MRRGASLENRLTTKAQRNTKKTLLLSLVMARVRSHGQRHVFFSANWTPLLILGIIVPEHCSIGLSHHTITGQAQAMHYLHRWKEQLGEALTNWEQPLPLATKIRLLARNLAIRFVKRQLCCGHPGEPGC